VKWKPPNAGWLKVNFDGAFDCHTRQGGLGFLIRDSNGQFLGGSSKALSNVVSAEHAELLACQAVVSLVIERSLSPVIIETDSIVVQQQLTSNVGLNSSILGRLYDDVRRALESIPSSRLCHTKRQANIAAHLLARSSFSSGHDFDWPTIPPDFISHVLVSDSSSS
jgi:ribonuclease HI